MNLLEISKNVQQLKKFVLNGQIADIISISELSAARTALQKVSTARDPRQQVWSAINHLESAHERLKPIYYEKRVFIFSTAAYYGRMQSRDLYVLCLMASCYYALDETNLCRSTLEDARDAARAVSLTPFNTALQFVDPRLWKEGYLYLTLGEDEKYGVDEVHQFVAALL